MARRTPQLTNLLVRRSRLRCVLRLTLFLTAPVSSKIPEGDRARASGYLSLGSRSPSSRIGELIVASRTLGYKPVPSIS